MLIKLEKLNECASAAVEEFLGIDNFILKAKIKGDKDEQLDEARTVESYHLHNKQKVTLAAGTPFGSRH